MPTLDDENALNETQAQSLDGADPADTLSQLLNQGAPPTEQYQQPPPEDVEAYLLSPEYTNMELEEQDAYKRAFDYAQSKTYSDSLIKGWHAQQIYVDKCRRLRQVDVSVESLQNQNILRPDETFIAARVIDANIKREQPSFISFLTQSRRLAIFDCVDDSTVQTQQLEEAFTKGMTYKGWEIPWFKCLDGTQMYGWDAVEVEYDPDKPLHVNISHVGNENLIFPVDAIDIQACPVIFRRYLLTKQQLNAFVKQFGFDPEQVKLICDKFADIVVNRSTIEIYKRYFKWEGIVYASWYFDKECTEWLKQPQRLYLGRSTVQQVHGQVSIDPVSGQPIQGAPTSETTDIPETIYPIFIQKYNISEQPAICKHIGRAALDEYKQEATCGLWTALINACNRASQVFGSPEQGDASGTAPKQLDTMMEGSRMFNQKINFWSPPWPDPMVIKTLDALDTQTQVETGQIAMAVDNRQDSRKTAEEVKSANQQQSLLSSVQVVLYSSFIRDVLSFTWEIVQSVSLRGDITLLPIQQQAPPTQPGMPPGQATMTNDIATLSHTYDVRPAGDVDVIERAEKLQRRAMMMSMAQTQPFYSAFVMDTFQEAFPDDYKKYEMAAQQQSIKNNLIQSYGKVVSAITMDDQGQHLKPEFAKYKPDLLQLQQTTQQVLSQPAIT